MSHIVEIKDLRVSDWKSLAAAVARMPGATCVVKDQRVRVFAAEVDCAAIVNLPGWKYPVAIGKDGSVKYDNYKGAWGEQASVDRLKQLYAVETAKAAARRQGYTVQERAGKDGALVLELGRA